MKFEITWLEDRSDEAVLEEIRRVAALEPGSRLTQRIFDSHSRIKSNAIRERFGSWTEATRKAGLSDVLPVYSDASIVEDLKRVSDSTQNERLTIALYSTLGNYSGSYIKRKFGGWREALDAAGIGNRFVGPQTTERMKSQSGRAMSDEEILARIRDVSARLGKAFVAGADIEANSEITQNLMYRRFGSVSAALRQAGVEQVSHGRRHTEDEVFENLLTVWTRYGRPPTALEMDRPPSSVGKSTYIKRYGGWRNALKAFIERANSETDVDPTLDTEKELCTVIEYVGPTENSTITGAIGARKVHSESKTGTHPSASRLARSNVQPEDRRDPSKGLRFKVLQRDHFRCVLCGDHQAQNVDCILHLDHLIPWSKGGRTREDNLRTLCATCNIGRGNRFND